MGNSIHISEINITPVKPNNGLVGFVSFIVNESFYIGSVAIITKHDGSIRLTYPTKLIKDKPINLFYPINKIVGELIEQKVLKSYEDVMNGISDVRYSSVNS